MTPAETAAWAELDAAAAARDLGDIAGLFAAEPDRLARLGLSVAGITIDASKQAIDARAHAALLALAAATEVPARIADLFAGVHVNTTEDRPALHMALRGPVGPQVMADGAPVDATVAAQQTAEAAFAEAVRAGTRRGATGRAFRSIVHIGIGGSDFGPRLVWDALLAERAPGFQMRFAANIDPDDLDRALDALDPTETLVIVVSKTFGTRETLANAEGARRWLEAGLGGRAAAGAHLVAVSANPQTAQAFGVAADAVFPFGAWVGGRYSVWSAVGLGLRIALAPGAFERFFAGAAAIDAHVRTAPIDAHAAVLKACVEIWNRSVLRRPARAVIPYARRLAALPQYLQQLEMESNGKSVRADGSPVTRPTAAIVFGTEGTNAQHAYFQQLHQGPDIIPVDFIGVLDDPTDEPDMTRGLLANMIAQGEAFMRGRTTAEAEAELLAAGRAAAEAKALAPHRTFTGGRPSTTLLLDRLDAERLGALIALHEHAVYVQAVMLGIVAFDQWGVELGKVLATRIEQELDGAPLGDHDPSTAALIGRVRAAFARPVAA